jgi:hypothetical protein
MHEVKTRDLASQRAMLLRRRLTISLVAICLIAAAFGITAARVVTLEMHTHPPSWVINAIPAVLSELKFGHSKRYTYLATVGERYFGALPERNVSSKSINLAIRKALDIPLARVGNSLALLGSDDKGIVDLIELGFQLFGVRAESVTMAYFALLLASCLVYLAAFWSSPSRLLLLAAFLGMLYLVTPMVAYNGQLQSLLALRALPVLSMVACLHCMLFMVGSLRSRVSVLQVGLVAAQVVLIAFTMHMRSTTLWQIVTIVGFGIVLLIARLRWPDIATVAWRWTALAVGTTIGLAIAGYVGLQAYQVASLPDEYARRDEIATRVFWHSLFSGLAFHPDFAERYHLRIDDSSVFAATRAYLLETGRADLWHEMGGDVPDFGGIKFAKYDPVVREMLFARCSTFLRECAEAVLYYKPIALAENLAWLYGLKMLPPNLEIVVPWQREDVSGQVKSQYLTATYDMDQQGQRAYPWTPIVLLIVVPFALLLVTEARSSVWATFAASVGLLLGSTIPTIVGFPVAHTILEPAIAVGTLFYLSLCFAVAGWGPVLLTHRWPRRRAVEASSPLETAAR